MVEKNNDLSTFRSTTQGKNMQRNVDVLLKSADGGDFSCVRITRKEVAEISELIQSILEKCSSSSSSSSSSASKEIELVVPSTNRNVLELIVRYMEKSTRKKSRKRKILKPIETSNLKEILVDAWDYDFVSEMSLETLCDLSCSADFLRIPQLVDLCLAKLMCSTHGKTDEEVLQLLTSTETAARKGLDEMEEEEI